MEEFPMSIDGNLARHCAIHAHCTQVLVQQYKRGPELCVCENIFSFFQINIPLFSATIFISKCVFVRVRAYDIYLVD